MAALPTCRTGTQATTAASNAFGAATCATLSREATHTYTNARTDNVHMGNTETQQIIDVL